MARKLKLDPHNARKHDSRNRDMISDSLQTFGAVRPIIIDKDDVVHAGNATYAEAEALGIPVEVIESDGSKLYAIRMTNLDDEQMRMYGLIDNESTLLGAWDTDELRRRLDQGDDLSQVWDAEALSKLLYPDEYLQNRDDEHVEFDADTSDPDAFYGLVVECPTEGDQVKLLDELTKRGLKCRALIS